MSGSIYSRMKTVAKIDPEQEYQKAKDIINFARHGVLDHQKLQSLDDSIDNIMTAARVLIEREEQRRGKNNKTRDKQPLKAKAPAAEKKEVVKLPSKRFPNVEVREDVIYPEKAPRCPCCDSLMKESGLFDVTEKLEVIPKRYYIQRNKKPKFNCGHCHGAMVNTPSEASVVPLSNYGDSFIIDVTLSKYCDLLPVERYVQIAARGGLEGLVPHSLIGQSHHLADFMFRVYQMIKSEVLASKLLLADETPHRMLEGDETSNWYLWGFFSPHASYFEAQGTRSGDVAFNFLTESRAKFLMTDRYGGYSKAIKDIKDEFDRDVVEVACNAHAVRYFKEASSTWEKECESFLKDYKSIYLLEEQRKKNRAQGETRAEMEPLFEKMRTDAKDLLESVMPKSALQKALNYFLKHYSELTLCTSNPELPLDNNYSERQLRAPVVGRKTWYGTHSKKGAMTMAVHFSIISSCKVNQVNPRAYYPWVVDRIHKSKEVLTPHQYSQLKETQ